MRVIRVIKSVIN